MFLPYSLWLSSSSSPYLGIEESSHLGKFYAKFFLRLSSCLEVEGVNDVPREDGSFPVFVRLLRMNDEFDSKKFGRDGQHELIMNEATHAEPLFMFKAPKKYV